MQRVAIISDIHGNVPALRTVLKDIGSRGIGRVLCLGDMVGKGPQPAEALDLVREHCGAVVAGNWEAIVADPEQQEADEAARWQAEALGRERLAWIAGLPFALDYRVGGKKLRLFHASPDSVYTRVQPWAPEKDRLRQFAESRALALAGCTGRPDLVGYGDVHHAFMQTLQRRLLFNAGSVGTPRDMPLACYCILEGEWDSDQEAPASLQFVRLPYDIAEAARIARSSDMPGRDIYLRQLTTMRPGG
ncbi:metallophosphoesterase family protein [Paenibacillus spiritus]|uniref:Metallophosphoesterase family protein n=1 Tax=Paenibacillus spiritus TaxID=2496557 RepID=A0A5J5G8U9_9BACL|nr:metallophosphoesterase family protein [Paenibacillus spiritus]KAA9004089.1 metallophosphoesterase family protein [Paenibacillus spiritus]